MAQRTTVMLVDDLDGSDADENLEFGLDGIIYEIDLTHTHAAALRDELAPYIHHARRTGRGRGSATPARRRPTATSTMSSSSAAGGREQNQAVREWAARHGHQLSTRGRIPRVVSDAFHRGDPAALPDTGTPAARQQPTYRRVPAGSRPQLPQRPPATRPRRVWAQTDSPARSASASERGPSRKASRSRPEGGSAGT